MTKVLLFGMDGAEPSLVFERWLPDLPNIRNLMNKGSYARMTSTIPPNTIVAWNSMISGRDTSELGIFSYTTTAPNGEKRLVNSRDIRCPLMWQHLSKYNKRGISLFVPLSFPVQPLNGCMISCFLTPGIESDCAFPPQLKEKIKAIADEPELFFDVTAGLANHKTLDPAMMVRRVYKMTEMQLKIAKDLLQHEPWDFYMMVMLGTDRLQHMLWKYSDETHRDHVPHAAFKSAIKDYYIYLDQELGKIMNMIDNDTVVIVASDHGMVKQEGKINLNNWLIQEGYLVLKAGIDTTQRQRFSQDFVDMDKTLAYGGGAYNGRIFINKKKAGAQYQHLREELIHKIKALPDDRGRALQTYVYKAEDIYKDTTSIDCPDLTIYFDDLRWASNPDLGMPGIYSWKTAIGADSAGHSRQGCFIIGGPGIKNQGKMSDIRIEQVAPTIMKIINIPFPADLSLAVKPLDVML